MQSKPKKLVKKRGKTYRNSEGIKKFGERLREIRLSKNITQEQLEHSTGFDLSQIGRIERGVINTSISHVFKLAECLGVAPSELFTFPSAKSEVKKGK